MPAATCSTLGHLYLRNSSPSTTVNCLQNLCSGNYESCYCPPFLVLQIWLSILVFMTIPLGIFCFIGNKENSNSLEEITGTKTQGKRRDFSSTKEKGKVKWDVSSQTSSFNIWAKMNVYFCLRQYQDYVKDLVN